jgi:hypothetical protein
MKEMRLYQKVCEFALSLTVLGVSLRPFSFFFFFNGDGKHFQKYGGSVYTPYIRVSPFGEVRRFLTFAIQNWTKLNLFEIRTICTAPTLPTDVGGYMIKKNASLIENKGVGS